MDFFELIEARHSIRGFSPRAIPETDIQKILEAINKAPSAGNLQAFEVYLATKAEHRQALSVAAFNQEFVAQAAAVLVFTDNPGRSSVKYRQRGEELYTIQDATIATTYAMLAAAALGIASCWVGAFSPQKVWTAIGAPQGETPIAMLPLGYAADEPRLRPRRALSDLVHVL